MPCKFGIVSTDLKVSLIAPQILVASAHAAEKIKLTMSHTSLAWKFPKAVGMQPCYSPAAILLSELEYISLAILHPAAVDTDK